MQGMWVGPWGEPCSHWALQAMCSHSRELGYIFGTLMQKCYLG